MKLLRRLSYFIFLMGILIFPNTISPSQAQGPAPFANCRLGVGGANIPYVGDYNIAQLNMGLYLDWNTRSNPVSEIGLPANVEYFQIVRVHQNKVGGWDSAYVDPPAYTVSPSLTVIASRAAAQRGALWFIGNEIDRRDWNGGRQDEITPELYATAFHQIRNVIKTADLTARVGIGSVVEATPLRLKYLDRVWDSYYNQYGYSMGNDVDVWNVHGFILREVRYSWGAEIPAGLNDVGGFLDGADVATVLEAHHNIAYFQEFTEALRNWMAAHGERNKPLINTEYGVLYKGLGDGEITPDQVSNYLTASFDYMLTATDEDTGFPADENRLVQGWVWYSLNDTSWNGALFNPTTKALTSVGTTWKNYVSNSGKPLASQPQPNLLVTNLRASPNPAQILPGHYVTVTLRADIANSGNTSTATGNNILVSFWDGDPNSPTSHQIGSTHVLKDIPGCGRFTTSEVKWKRGVGIHTWYVKVEPIASETRTSDNLASSVVSVIAGTPVADLAVAKTVSDDAPFTGDSIKYTISLTNNGPDLVTEVVVNDQLPDGVTFDSYVSTRGNYYTSGPWILGTMASDASATLTITARVNDGQAGHTIVNTASITSANRNDAVPSNDRKSVSIVPAARPKTYLPIIHK